MSAALLHVNVLVALFDPAQPAARMGNLPPHGQRLCSGAERSRYPTAEAAPAEVIARLRTLISGPEHQFWTDSVSLLDEALFRPQLFSGHQQINEICLLGLAVLHKGKFATLERSIPVKAVVGAGPAHLELIGSARSA